MSRAKPSLAWQNIARGIYQPPARGVPQWAQAIIAVLIIVGFCLLVAAAGGGAG